MTVKQVVVVRRDLNMRTGKIAAQSAHASISFLTTRLTKSTMIHNLLYLPSRLFEYKLRLSIVEREWLKSGFAKIVAQVSSEEELLDIEKKAREAGLTVHLITDSGHTEFHGVPTRTCLAIGPNYSDEIDKITGHLKLY